MTDPADGGGNLADEAAPMSQDESDERQHEYRAYDTWAWEGGAQ